MLIVIMFDTAMKQDSQVVLGGFEGGGGGLNCERCSHTAFTDNADCHHV